MSEVEKRFFKTFKIKPIKTNKKYIPSTGECIEYELRHPLITDSILLELICLADSTDYFLITNERIPTDIERLKNSVLHKLIFYSKFYKDLKYQVQALFKGERR